MGHAERFGAFKHWPEEFVVEVTPVDVAVYQCPEKAVVTNGALRVLEPQLRGRASVVCGQIRGAGPGYFGEIVAARASVTFACLVSSFASEGSRALLRSA